MWRGKRASAAANPGYIWGGGWRWPCVSRRGVSASWRRGGIEAYAPELTGSSVARHAYAGWPISLQSGAASKF
jgi:hypothetical protein